jgi:hypothetical protein
VAPEASREETEHGTVFKADGWYVLNARDARWYHVGGYTVDAVALRHEAGVEEETTEPDAAYTAVRAKYGTREPQRYRDGWLP